MAKRVSFEIKERMVTLAGTCFWYWDSFYSFLDSCGVSKELQRRYPREAYSKYEVMRNILSDIEEKGDFSTIDTIVSNFYRLRAAVDREKVDEKKAKNLLGEFREIVGNDPIEREIEARKRKETRANYEKTVQGEQSRRESLQQLNARFMALSSLTGVTAQQRGYRLEDLFFDLLQFNEFEFTRPFRTPGKEQIDGHFRYEKFDYLVEVKWENGLTKQADLSIFDGKIRGKAQSTRGLFLSAEGFDTEAIKKFSGDAPRIVLMTGQDLALILGGHPSFADAMKTKVDAIVRHGSIYLPLSGV